MIMIYIKENTYKYISYSISYIYRHTCVETTYHDKGSRTISDAFKWQVAWQLSLVAGQSIITVGRNNAVMEFLSTAGEPIEDLDIV